MSQTIILFSFFLFLLPRLPALPDPDPPSVQTFLPTPSPPTTIPAIPEQSDVASCQLDLSDDLFDGVWRACNTKRSAFGSDRLHQSRCCPVLAAWLYSAYAQTALHMATTARSQQTTLYEMPILPDDTETCVDSVEKALENKGIKLVKPNETCDFVYCYCGIRLHQLTCPEAFSVSPDGKLVGAKSVKKLERNCFSNSPNGYSGLGGCSKCLNSLYLLNEEKSEMSSKSESRTSKMHNRDCELMGLTWLLAKNRSAYIHTVSAVLRALMTSKDGADPQSCSLNSDGMPLAVDSSEINGQSSSTILQSSVNLHILFLSLLYISLTVFFVTY